MLTLAGNFVGPLIFKPADAPEYNSGFLIVTVTSIVAGLLAVVYRYVCIWENKKRDRAGAEAFDHAYEDDLTDMKVCIDKLYQAFLLTWLAEPAIPVPAVIARCASKSNRKCSG